MSKQLTTAEREKADRIREFFDARKDGRIFSVQFIKRTTGEKRKMVCRRFVHKYVKGVELDRAETDREIGCLTVYDMDVARGLPESERDKAYRRISLENIIEMPILENEGIQL